MTPYPMLMKPSVKEYIWGSEAWIVSTHPDGLSTVANGELAGQTLGQALGMFAQRTGVQQTGSQRTGADIGQNRTGSDEQLESGCSQTGSGTVEHMPVLIKVIDARKALSLQVHPDDKYARFAEGGYVQTPAKRESGKNEMWYVTDAMPGAELVLGFCDDFIRDAARLSQEGRRDKLRRLIETGEIISQVRRVPVKAGDSFCIPAGMLHAIGKGIKIIEVQQPSNLTYRVFDYGRVDGAGRPRELHIEKALDVLDVSARAVPAKGNVLADWEFFRCELRDVSEQSVLCVPDSRGFECLVLPEGELTLSFDGGSVDMKKGDCAVVPAETC